MVSPLDLLLRFVYSKRTSETRPSISVVLFSEHIFGWLETFPVLLAILVWTLIPLGFRLSKQREKEEDLNVIQHSRNSPTSFGNPNGSFVEHQRSNSVSSSSAGSHSYKYGLPKRPVEMTNNDTHLGQNGNFGVYGRDGGYVGYV